MTSKTSHSRLGKLNPNFAAAHGIGKKSQPKREANRLEHALQTARSTGKLNASNLDFSAPLPDELFDLRETTVVDLSMDSSLAPSYESYGEDTLTMVNLSDNPIGGTLDARIEQYRSIGAFRAQRCKLEAVPVDSIAKLDCLTILDLRGNQLTSFQIEFLPLSIGELRLSSNQIVSLSTKSNADLSALPNLSLLDVAENRLGRLPSLKLHALETLICGHNEISEIPLVDMACSSTLRTLQATHNKIESTPDLATFSCLQIVDLSENRLRDVPLISSSVVTLDLHINKIQRLSHIPEHTRLMDLNLSCNQIQKLDSSIVEHLIHIRTLDLRSNSLESLPPVMGYLANVNRFLLEGNPLRTLRSIDMTNTQAVQATLRKRGPAPTGKGYLPNEWMDAAKESATSSMISTSGSSTGSSSLLNNALLAKIPILDLDSQGLSSVPVEVIEEIYSSGYANSITCVKLGNNQLVSLEERFFEVLQQMKIWDAPKNKIDQLPKSISMLPLHSISLQMNRLCSDAISPLFLRHFPIASTLTFLDLSSNRLTWIPSGIIEGMSALQTLNLSNNQIISLATEDGNRGWKPGLPALEHLDLSNNHIQTLGDAPILLAAHCRGLQSLLLQHNHIDKIPLELGLIEHLKTIDLRGNPQRAIRAAVLEKTCSTILEYLRDRMSPEALDDAMIRIQAASENS
jgi:Leucine-rich repeat (LRR) protein